MKITKEIDRMFRDYGLELLDNNYIDKKTMLKCKTGDGYIIIFSIYNVINKNKIFIVHRDNPYSIYNIRIYMSQFNPTSKLVSENYINNTEKLTFICGNCGKEYQRNWADTRSNKKICPKCSRKEISDMQKLDFEHVYNIYKEHNLKLLDKEYKNNHTPMVCETCEGYTVQICLGNLQTGQSYYLFHASNPYTINNIKLFLKKSNSKIKLLSREYKDNLSLLDFECIECNSRFARNWSKIYSGKTYCPICRKKENIDNQKINFDEVKRLFYNRGLIIDDGQAYINNTTPLAVTDMQGYKGFQSYGNLDREFLKFSKTFNMENFIFNLQNYCKLNNIETKPLEIINTDRHGHPKALFQCKCGNTFETYTCKFTNGQKNYCDKCTMAISRIERLTIKWLEENHISYIREKTFEDCISDKNYPYYFDFYISSYNTIIECDGRQHVMPIWFGGKKEQSLKNFNRLQENDKIKNKYCKDKGINMLRISYIYFKDDKYKEILSNHFNIN